MFLKTFSLILLLVLAAAGGAIIRNSVSLVDPPGIAKRLSIYLGHNSARTAPDHEFPELRIRVYPLSAEELSHTARRAIEDVGWTENGGGDNGALHAVAATPWLRFKDDITIELESESARRTRVHVVSRSRVGRADFGANIRHIHDYYQALSARAGNHTSLKSP